MSCERARPLLSALVDGDISDADHAWLADHLATCDDCQQRLADFRRAGFLIRRLNRPHPPSALRDDLRRRLQPASALTGQSPALARLRATMARLCRWLGLG